MKIDHQFLLRLRQLAIRTRAADPTLHNLAYFRTPTDGELAQLRKSVTALLAEAISCSRQLLDEILPFLDGTPLEDLAAIARDEVISDLRAIEGETTQTSSTWQIGIAAVQLLSKILKSAAAVENAYCHELKLESEITHVADLTTALEIRQVYQKFWKFVEAKESEETREPLPRLRSAATAIARLTGRSVFLDMRVIDRQLLLRLQRRILGWLSGDQDEAEGRRHWQDILAYVELMTMINHRRELVEHDLALIPELMSDLGDRAEATFAFRENPSLFMRAQALRGRDQILDDFLAEPESVRAARLLERLGQVEADALCAVQLPQAV